MEARFLEDPEVLRMVQLAVKRKLRMFDRYNDLDRDALVQDMMGEVALADYNPAKSKPATFAYRVAWCRLLDKSRRRTTETKHLDNARVIEGVRLSHVGPDEITEGTDEELAEILRRFYITTKNLLEGAGIELRPAKLSPVYPDKAQRYALLMLQRHMEWSCREAEKQLSRRPKVLEAIGLSNTPKRSALSLAAASVQHIKKIIEASRAAAML